VERGTDRPGLRRMHRALPSTVSTCTGYFSKIRGRILSSWPTAHHPIIDAMLDSGPGCHQQREYVRCGSRFARGVGVYVKGTGGCLVVDARMLPGCLEMGRNLRQRCATSRRSAVASGVLRSQSDAYPARVVVTVLDIASDARLAMHCIRFPELLTDASLPFHGVEVSPCLGWRCSERQSACGLVPRTRVSEPLMRRRHRTHTG
jgi:hypothetical protein